MLFILSPAKSLDYTSPVAEPIAQRATQPDFLPQAAQLIEILRDYSPSQIAELMSLSDSLSVLNVTRYAEWTPDFSLANARPALTAFNGDVYEGLDALTLAGGAQDYLQQHVRILSGLYGLLRPWDLMQAYRLEMGTKLANPAGKDLYAFWGNALRDALQALLEDAAVKGGDGAPVLVNLASVEYAKAARLPKLDARVVTPVFQDWKGGQYKIVSFYAKRARGLMTRYAAEQQITVVEDLKGFNLEGYAFDEANSSVDEWVFRRRLDG